MTLRDWKSCLGLTGIFCLAMGAAPTTGRAAIIINEVYGGGGSSSGSVTYKQDYVDLYNTSATPVSLAGYLLQYASASATGTFNQNIFNFDVGSVIGPNDYLLINTGSPGTGGATNPTPNGTGGVSLAAASGSVRLLDNTGATVDLVGYGTITPSTLSPAPVRFEGTGPAPTESITLADIRTGFVDTDNNAADFTSTSPSSPAPAAGLTSTAIPFVAVPEPASLAMLGTAAALLAGRRSRRSA